MTRRKKNQSTTQSSAVVLRTAAPITAAPVVVVTTKAKRRRNRKKKNTSTMLTPSKDIAGLWAQTLNDPFSFPPVKIGLGVMIPTRLCTGYTRTVATANADGSFQIWFNPFQLAFTASSANGGFLIISNAAAGAAPTFLGIANPDDQTSIKADFDQFRVISAGIRAWPMQARTASPGMTGSGQYNPDVNGSVPNGTASASALITTSALMGLNSATIELGYDPVQVVYRPDDLSRFNFQPLSIGTNTSSVALGPALFVAGESFPASTTIFIECVAHYEAYSSSKQSSQATVVDTVASAAEQGYASVDSLWNTTKKMLIGATEVARDVSAYVGGVQGVIGALNTFQQLNGAMARGGNVNLRPFLMGRRGVQALTFSSSM